MVKELIITNNADIITSLGGVVVGVILTFCLLVFIVNLTTTRKTKRYRIELADMYVSARIRQIAREMNIDLSEEYLNFQKWLKKQKMENNSYQLDDVVEEDLKERILIDVEPKEVKK